jgi:HD-GYP domain-containing protein (c-di-GMP phosphodiesterase class II)
MKEIERVSGSQLDPMIVEIFKEACDGHPDFIRGEQKQDEDKEN